jgi:hypothetical protein
MVGVRSDHHDGIFNIDHGFVSKEINEKLTIV